MKIGEVSRRYAISKDKLYFYINSGLLVPPRLNTQYVFNEETLSDLETILALKHMDYSLKEIHRILSLHRISGVENPQDRMELLKIYQAKHSEILNKIRSYEKILDDLDVQIDALSKETAAPVKKSGLPLSMLSLLCCPHCRKELRITDVSMDMEFIYAGKLSCDCGYSATIEDGILITPHGYRGEKDVPDVERKVYKDLPDSLISLFQRAYNFMDDALMHMNLSGKVIMETYINAWFYLHNHHHIMSPDGRYIVVDKFPETLRMFKELLERDGCKLPILYLCDSSKDYPLRRGIVDLNLDFFAINEHQFYADDFLMPHLSPYLAPDAKCVGTYFWFENGKHSMEKLLSEYPECSPRNFSLSFFLTQMKASGFTITSRQDCGFTTSSGNNIGFSFHCEKEKMHLESYVAARESLPGSTERSPASRKSSSD